MRGGGGSFNLWSLGFDSSRRQQRLWGQQSENRDLPKSSCLGQLGSPRHLREGEQALRQSLCPVEFFLWSHVPLHFLSQPWPVRLGLTVRRPHEGEYIQSSKSELMQTRNVFFLLQENRKLQRQPRARGGEARGMQSHLQAGVGQATALNKQHIGNNVA